MLNSRLGAHCVDRAGLGRRDVAVLFADISGFTRLVESVDPETVYAVVRPLLDELVQLVRGYGGEIQQVLGDGFMAVFGLRREAADDLADRAVCAGLALVSAGGPARAHPSVHVGVEYGEVLVTPSWETARFGVWGRPVNLAKRLCDLAGPGEVQVGPAAYERAGCGLAVATPVPARLKGITGDVLAHRVAGTDRRRLARAS
jgi:class 3 adenylate cyclase